MGITRMRSAVLAALFACCAAAGAAAQTVPLTLRVFPPNADVTIDGVLVPGRADAQARRLFPLRRGAHVLGLSAPGYVARELAVDLSSARTIETKLERDGPILRRIGEVRTGVQPKSVQFTPDGGSMVCPLLEGKGIELVSLSGLARQPLVQPPKPWASAVGFVESAFIPRRGELWITQMTSGRVHIFTTAGYSWQDSIPTGGSYPKVITLSDDQKTAYVSNWVSRDISVINVDTRRVTAIIPVRGTPRGMALSADGGFLYVCIFDSGAIRKIDLARRAVVKTLDFGPGAMRHIVRDSVRNLLYASDMGTGRVFVIDPDTDTRVKQIDVDTTLNTIALSPDGKYLFVSSRGPNNPDDYTKKGPSFGKVYCLSTDTGEIVDWTWGGNQPTGLAVSPDGRLLAFTDFLDDTIELYGIGP